MFSANEDAANAFERLGASLISSTEIINSNEVILTHRMHLRQWYSWSQFHNPVY
jgi:hypothetical protein